jgi:Uma2 family endonuclease
MNAPLQQGTYTPEDLLQLSEPGYELLDGHLVEKGMGAKASVVGTALIILLGQFVRAGRLGFVLEGEGGGYELFPGRNHVRKPDVSFLRRGRLPDDILPDGWLKIPPDFAAEVVSPNDKAEEVFAKAREWLGVGVRLLWVLSPASRTAFVFRPDGSAAWVGAGGTLSGEEIVPGFTCAVDDLFADV